MAVIVARPPWSKQVKDTIDYLKKKKYEEGDRLVKANELRELLHILGMSMHGWNQWFHSTVMEEFDEKQLTALCVRLSNFVKAFLVMDYEYTKDMEDKRKKERKKKAPMQKPKENNRYIA